MENKLIKSMTRDTKIIKTIIFWDYMLGIWSAKFDIYQKIGSFKLKIQLPPMLKSAVIFKGGSLLKKTILIDIEISPNIDK